MIDLHASSAKLRDRAARMVAELAGSDYKSAREQLESANWNLRAVIEKVGAISS
jgi:N-acetylmuramic acid 6-phosphate (MurNAc-6-P) etherase